MLAVQYLKEYVEDSDVLIQIWMPTKIGGQNVLSTIDQPYSLNPNCRSLASYRNVSKTFHLTVEENSKESAGLPGRVFLGKLPEWTPDAVDLKSSQDFFPLGVKACNEFYQISVPEISEILQFVCKTHGLPLAVTWALCDWQGEAEHWQFSEKYDYCISTVDSACYVADSDLLGFMKHALAIPFSRSGDSWQSIHNKQAMVCY
ncbi:hypothetical protein GH714_010292 [Hevea brasiliensis]|uniref:NLP1-9 GAF domain-containing protein n=1 Tax=Hevea brasiliensis TaxID=3981 RepID=A0A6A6L411_HEVBR|nr:hypothetical protein GH714_010292 [Hevea brasiliensis]